MDKLKKAGKLMCIIGGAILIIGAVVFACGMTAEGWDLTRLSTVRYVEREFVQGDEEINAVDLHFRNSNVEIVVSEDVQSITLTYPVREDDDGTTAEVRDGKLTLEEEARGLDLFAWDFGAPAAKLTLPSDALIPVKVRTENGNVTVSSAEYAAIEVETDNGNITIKDVECVSLDAQTANGNITIGSLTCADGMTAETDNGNITATGEITAQSVTASGDTGNIELTGGTVTATRIELRTDVGNIRATLAGNVRDYTVTATTDVGDSNISDGGNGRFTLTVTTNVGNIDIAFAG